MILPTYISSSTQTKAYSLLRKHAYGVLSRFDINATYWSMLGVIFDAKDGIRQVEIAKTLHVKAPLVTLMSQELQGKGLIKVAQNQFDARAKLLAVTADGKKFIKTVETELHSELLKLLDGLTEADMITYHKVLSTIITNDSLLEK